jgi:hypothetical protein
MTNLIGDRGWCLSVAKGKKTNPTVTQQDKGEEATSGHPTQAHDVNSEATAC